MESSTNDKADSAAQENPSNHSNPPTNEDGGGGELAGNRPRRTPFTNLSQVDADLALARTLQEQERAYMMLRMGVGVGAGVGVGGDGGSDYGSWETASFEHDGEFDEDDYDNASGEDGGGASDAEVNDGERDAFDEHAHVDGEEDDDDDSTVELDPSAFPDDESFARALQEAEEQDMAARLLALAGINESEDGDEYEDEDEGDNGGNSQDAWEDVDPDELSYEELLALGEIVGTESRGLSAETIASLPSINYKSQENQEGISDSCVICRLDFEDDEALILLSCKHSYHSDCINNWLQINKVCPVCSTEVSTPLRS